MGGSLESTLVEKRPSSSPKLDARKQVDSVLDAMLLPMCGWCISSKK